MMKMTEFGGMSIPPANTEARHLPIGAELQPQGGAHFRVWAPRSSKVEVLLGGRGLPQDHQWRVPLHSEGNEYHSGYIAEATEGMRYRLLLDHGDFPDPASRFQPEGPHGPSQLVDPARFQWTDQSWPGVVSRYRVVYEMHIGTFTEEGTWEAARRRLPELAELNVTLLEVMPLADFPGSRGWGYDGVNLFAPTRLYGEPDDFRRFVDEAHRLGLGVILDVVYNHLGPDGNYLPQFSADFFHKHHISDWGDTLNFDGDNCHGVRELFCTNAAYWIEEFHLDGLRLDAVHQIFDDSAEHVLKELTARARKAAGTRPVYIVAENEAQQGHLARSESAGGYDLDAAWSDDFHHSAMAALIKRQEMFFMDYDGSNAELCAATEWGYLFQGQISRYSGEPRGTSALDLEPWSFVVFLQNHDQVANPAWGRRLHELVPPATLRAMTAWLLLGPNTPLLFQGQEFAASSPFYYFSDMAHWPDLAEAITKGRAEQSQPFAAVVNEMERESSLAIRSQEVETFLCCKLRHEEREHGVHQQVWQLHRDLLQIRRESRLIGKCARGRFSVSPLGNHGLMLRYFDTPEQEEASKEDLLLLVNLGDENLEPSLHPLLAPPLDTQWRLEWCSAMAKYGGDLSEEEAAAIGIRAGFKIPARTALLFEADGSCCGTVVECSVQGVFSNTAKGSSLKTADRDKG